ncbi:MAG: sulfatase-like hydrolase/transferase, partial [Bryobacteraceae bacterium]
MQPSLPIGRRELLLGAASEVQAQSIRRPNVVIFLTDQQRFDSLGCYGHPLSRTPHLDRLAASGARFDSTYCATPLCSPARASIFSGVYPHRHGITDLWGKIPSAIGPVPGWPNPSRAELPWMGELFTKAGYHTAYCGKWHCLTGAARPGFAETLSRYGDPDDIETDDQDDFAAFARAKGYRFAGHAHSKGTRAGFDWGTS